MLSVAMENDTHKDKLKEKIGILIWIRDQKTKEQGNKGTAEKQPADILVNNSYL